MYGSAWEDKNFLVDEMFHNLKSHNSDVLWYYIYNLLDFVTCCIHTISSYLYELSNFGPNSKMCLICKIGSKLYKNAAKRSRQHAGKEYWEYAQRHVCFVNEQ